MKLFWNGIMALLIIVAIPMFIWGTMSQNLETRQFAQADITPTITPSLTPTLSPTPTSIANVLPVCTGLSTIPASGAVPITVLVACSGNDRDNDITGAEFDFGEGNKQLVESNIGQFGSITTSHTYTNPGTYSIICRLKDNNQAFSSVTDYCKKNISAFIATTPVPTKSISGSDDLIIYSGSNSNSTPPMSSPTPEPTMEAPLPTPTIISTSQNNSKLFQLGQILLISVITIAVGLILRQIIGGSE